MAPHAGAYADIRSSLIPATGPPATITTTRPTYDAHGNTRDDGKFIHEYDIWGHLTRVFARTAPGVKGKLYAQFGYDALGRLASAVYDTNSTNPLPNDPAEAFADDTIEYYAYDEDWRLVGVYKQRPPSEELGEQVRPIPVAAERYLHRQAGLATGGKIGGSSRLDSPTICELNDDWAVNVSGGELGTPTFERKR